MAQAMLNLGRKSYSKVQAKKHPKSKAEAARDAVLLKHLEKHGIDWRKEKLKE